MKVFMDLEFTGLRQSTTLISIGLIAEDGEKEFYAEFTDYNRQQVDDWIRKNVLEKRRFSTEIGRGKTDTVFGNGIIGCKEYVRTQLNAWFSLFDKVEIWGDCLAYDWVLFCNIWGTAFDIPKHIYYIPFDICTLFKVAEVNPDINRESYVNLKAKLKEKHLSIWDAKVIMACYKKLCSVMKKKGIKI